jgi:hypothetical protein
MLRTMTPSELRAIRALMGLDPDRMAAQIGVTPHVYAAFEAGTLRVPRRHAQIAAHYGGAAAQAVALAASGLAVCEWSEEWSRSIPPWGSPKLKPHLASGRDHFRACSVCQARAAYVEQHCPPVPEFPIPWTYRAVRGAARWIRQRFGRLARRERA